MASNKEINNEMEDRLWAVINENTELRQRLYMMEEKLERIKKLLG